MLNRIEVKQLINDMLEEEALLIGGFAALGDITDSGVWQLIRNLDLIRSRTLQVLDQQNVSRPPKSKSADIDLTPHPAVEDFLMKLRRS